MFKTSTFFLNRVGEQSSWSISIQYSLHKITRLHKIALLHACCILLDYESSSVSVFFCRLLGHGSVLDWTDKRFKPLRHSGAFQGQISRSPLKIWMWQMKPKGLYLPWSVCFPEITRDFGSIPYNLAGFAKVVGTAGPSSLELGIWSKAYVSQLGVFLLICWALWSKMKCLHEGLLGGNPNPVPVFQPVWQALHFNKQYRHRGDCSQWGFDDDLTLPETSYSPCCEQTVISHPPKLCHQYRVLN